MRSLARAVAVVAAALAVLLGSAGPGPALAGPPAPLEEARSAAQRTAFEGLLEVVWRDGDTTRSERIQVQGFGGSLLVRGANLVIAGPSFERLLSHGGRGWEEMWLPSLAPSPRPDAVPKYRTTAPAEGPWVAGRRTTVVEVHHDDRLLERIYLDTETKLLLERAQYDPGGAVVRTLAFESLVVGARPTPPTEPASPASHAPKAVPADRVSPAVAPPTMADGYERIGIYRNGAVLHVLYSDGLYDLSLFAQQGRLRRSDLPPSGERVAVGESTGWRYSWQGGQLVVWSAGGRIFTAVSDAPPEQVLAAVRSLPPQPSRELSLLAKVRRACQAVMEPLA